MGTRLGAKYKYKEANQNGAEEYDAVAEIDNRTKMKAKIITRKLGHSNGKEVVTTQNLSPCSTVNFQK